MKLITCSLLVFIMLTSVCFLYYDMQFVLFLTIFVCLENKAFYKLVNHLSENLMETGLDNELKMRDTAKAYGKSCLAGRSFENNMLDRKGL